MAFICVYLILLFRLSALAAASDNHFPASRIWARDGGGGGILGGAGWGTALGLWRRASVGYNRKGCLDSGERDLDWEHSSLVGQTGGGVGLFNKVAWTVGNIAYS